LKTSSGLFVLRDLGARRARSLRYADHSLEGDLRGQHLPVAGGQVTEDVEAPLPGRARVPAGAAGDAEGHAVGVRRGADVEIRHQHEGVAFDEDLVAGL
jgi:hypothetical protein